MRVPVASDFLLFLSNYGWYIVALLLIWYFAQPYLIELAAKRSLAIANAPDRRARLDAEKRRVRVKQQLELIAQYRDENNEGEEQGEALQGGNGVGEIEDEDEDQEEERDGKEGKLSKKKNN